jgi:hypothetical protein
MKNRLCAFLLILICGFNSTGASGSFSYRSEKSSEPIAITQSPDFEEKSYQAGDVASADNVGPAHHSDDDEQDSDCGSQHKNCHQCHLGHCQFLVASGHRFVPPNLTSWIQYLPAFSYLDIDLSGLKKPPRA